MKSVFIATIVFLTTAISVAGNSVGNGGDVVYCPHNRTAELLDHYEGRVFWGITPDLGDAQLSVEDKLGIVLDRVRIYDPFHAEKWEDEIKFFWSNVIFLPGVDLVDISDSEHVAIPAGCRISQIAIQKRPTFPRDKYYTVSKNLWDMLSSDGKAGLVLHEVLFKEALSNYHKDSRRTRYLNANISSNLIQDAANYRSLMEASLFDYPFLWSDKQGWWFLINPSMERPSMSCSDFSIDSQIAEFAMVTAAYPDLAVRLQNHNVFGAKLDHSTYVNPSSQGDHYTFKRIRLSWTNADEEKFTPYHFEWASHGLYLCLSKSRPDLELLQRYHSL